jgi:7-cyano-7-deazaguanine reductase
MNKETLKVLQSEERDYGGDTARLVECSMDEFSVISPVSDLPDFGAITVRYVPCGKLVELQSLRHYLLAYREAKMILEDAVHEILGDLVEVLEPLEMEIEGEFHPRGGVSLGVSSSYAAHGDGCGCDHH